MGRSGGVLKMTNDTRHMDPFSLLAVGFWRQEPVELGTSHLFVGWLCTKRIFFGQWDMG